MSNMPVDEYLAAHVPLHSLESSLEGTRQAEEISARSLGSSKPPSKLRSGVSGTTKMDVRKTSLQGGQEIGVDELAQAITLSMSNIKGARQEYHFKGDGPHVYEDEDGNVDHLDFSTSKGLERKNHAPPMVSVFGREYTRSFFVSYVVVPSIVAFILIVTLSVIFTRPGPRVREYFIAADEVEWDYAPQGYDVCHNSSFGYKPSIFTKHKISAIPGDSRIGTKYTKARFVQYTDSTFTTKVALGDKWEHLGLLGPPIRAEVGDRIKVTLKNNARIAVSLTTHAGMGDKQHEGVGYNDGTLSLFKKDDALAPFSLGQATCNRPAWMTDRRRLSDFTRERSTYDMFTRHELVTDSKSYCQPNQVFHGESSTYIWDVEEKHGPGTNDPSSIVWSYQSHVGGMGRHHHSGGQGVGDVNAGLIGPVIISRRGLARSQKDLMPADVDREFVLLNHVTNENDSPYLNANIRQRITLPAMGKYPSGYVAFGKLDKVRVLQELYRRAASALGQDKLSYAEAAAVLKTANDDKKMVDEVHGQYLRIWFDQTSFNPEKYDAVNGGQGTAEEVVLGMYRGLVDPADPKFMESNMMHGQNGWVYCNGPVMKMKQGERVRWYNLAVGGFNDMHTPHWHGNTLLVEDGYRVDELDMLAGTAMTADMDSLNPGKWFLHCHVNDHIMAGMASVYEIEPGSDKTLQSPAASTAGSPAEYPIDRSEFSLGLGRLGGTTRKYFIALEEVDWDYMKTDCMGMGKTSFCGGGRSSYSGSGSDSGPSYVDKCSSSSSSAGVPLSTESARPIASDGGVHRIGSTYKKVKYFEYTDATFATKKPVTEETLHLGILGPVLRAEVGDTMEVSFKNKARYTYSMHPHGVHYSKRHEGAAYSKTLHSDAHLHKGASFAGPDDIVPSGGSFTYEWQVPESAGPGPKDLSSNVWLYHSHTREVNDTNAGAIGAIIVSRKGEADWTAGRGGRPKGVDNEFVLLMNVLDESKSDYIGVNMQDHLPNFEGNDLALSAEVRAAHNYRLQKHPEFIKSNKMRAINGKSWCSLAGLSFKAGANVRWHVVSLGDETPHFASWQGHTLNWHGRRVEGLALMAATMKTADMVSTSPGESWLLYSQVYKDVYEGMRAKFRVESAGLPSETITNSGSVRTYYIGADEVEWNYLPFGKSKCPDEKAERVAGAEDETLAFTPEVELYTKEGEHRIGATYVKAQYREYRDGSFGKLQYGQNSRSNEVSQHLGLLGPVMRAKPGDMINVHFKNFLRFPCNLHLHGLQPVEGFDDSTLPVPPGERRNYRWKVTSQATPNTSSGADSDAIAFLYESVPYFTSGTGTSPSQYSSSSSSSSSAYDGKLPLPFAGADSGLMGVGIVSTGGSFPGREFVTVFNTMNENKSPYLELNTLQHARNGHSVVKNHPIFKESNTMQNVNGYMFCNMPNLAAPQSRRTRWFVFGRGSDTSTFTPRWSGQAISVYGSHTSAIELMPGSHAVVEMKPEKFGHWLVQDQNQDHARKGMQVLLQVHARIAASASG